MIVMLAETGVLGCAQMTESPRYTLDQPPRGARRSLLGRVPVHAEVLDIGCWSGSIGKFLIEERSAEVDGIEPDTRMAEIAALSYRRVIGTPVEEALAEGLAATSAAAYDALIFFDVLEHLADPCAVLRECRGLLKAPGRGFISLPNVAHWSVRKELALGRWRYTESGLLDRTHLRFFTIETAWELLLDCGWEIVWQGAAIGQPPLVTLSERRLQVLARWPALFGVQILFEVRPV